MPDALEVFVKAVHRKLQMTEAPPPLRELREIGRVAYFASLKREEARPIRGSLTYADPSNPERYPPLRFRANYPQFHRFESPEVLTPQSFAKLSRAVDRWSASLATYPDSAGVLRIWGVLDQMVGNNVAMTRESEGHYGPVGDVLIGVDGPGELTAYYMTAFIAAVRHDQVIRQEHYALQSQSVRLQVVPHLRRWASAVSVALGGYPEQDALTDLLSEWENTVARLCITIRRAGTGGLLLLAGSHPKSLLSSGTEFRYERLARALLLGVVDDNYQYLVRGQVHDATDRSENVATQLYIEQRWADADAEDRRSEMTGAVKLVASLASIDGAVVLDPVLRVQRFGTKILPSGVVDSVYEGPSIKGQHSAGRVVDLHRFGTRHLSALAYCRANPSAIAIVISQDGPVRVVTNFCGKLLLWDEVSLLRHSLSLKETLAIEQEGRDYRKAHARAAVHGYTDMPKTIEELEALADEE